MGGGKHWILLYLEVKKFTRKTLLRPGPLLGAAHEMSVVKILAMEAEWGRRQYRKSPL